MRYHGGTGSTISLILNDLTAAFLVTLEYDGASLRLCGEDEIWFGASPLVCVELGLDLGDQGFAGGLITERHNAASPSEIDTMWELVR